MLEKLFHDSFLFPKIIYILLFIILLLLCLFHEKIYNYYLKRIKQYKKILIIDDKNFPYFSELQNSGYKIEKINDLDTKKFEEIIDGEYSIVLLDIKGVGRKLRCHDEGLGILIHLKEKRSRQCILIFSDEQWGLEHQEKFKIADKTLSKTSGLLEFKKAIDNLLIKSDAQIIYLTIKFIKLAGSLWKKIF